MTKGPTLEGTDFYTLRLEGCVAFIEGHGWAVGWLLEKVGLTWLML